jgi:putative endonuclease
MAAHNEMGKKGEELAAAWLPGKDFSILHRNWCHKNLEVDIIAVRNNILHFIEVKFRSTSKYGHPEESMSKKKIQNLINAAEQFVYLNPSWTRVQFDVLSITLGNDTSHEYFFIEDVYE